MTSRDRPFPRLTVTVLGITAGVTAWAAVDARVVEVLARSPGVRSGEWWRLVTPVLINPEGGLQRFVNGVGLVALGVLVERMLGRARWAACYVSGAVAGQCAGLAWQPVGAGSSVAIAGLLGAAAAILWFRVATLPARFGATSIVLGAIVLAAVRDLHGPPILAGAIVATLVPEHPTL